MKDVTWGDFFLALLLTPVLVFPVVGLVYVVFFVLMDFNQGAQFYWWPVTVIAACVSEGLFLASTYKGEGKAIEHAWAWPAVAGAIAVVTFSLHGAGAVSAEGALALSLSLIDSVALVFLITMLAIFFSARSNAVDIMENQRSDLGLSSKIVMLGKWFG